MVLLKKVVIIAGTPGTGKSIICSKLAETCGAVTIDLGQVALEKGFVIIYDELRNTYVIDEENLVIYVRELVESLSGIVVLQTHYPEIVPRDLVDMVIVLRAHPLVLEKRLLERGWGRRKVNENVMAEILGVVAINALNAFGEDRVFEVDTTSIKPELVDFLCSAIKGLVRLEPGIKVDWLSVISPEEVARFEDYVGGEN